MCACSGSTEKNYNSINILLKLYKKGIQRGDIHSLLVSQGHTGTCTVCKQRGFQYVIQGVIEVNS